MSQQVQFIQLTQYEYNNLSSSGKIQQNRLYFISDTHDIYKGTVRYAIGQVIDHRQDVSTIDGIDSRIDSRVQTALNSIDEIECETLEANGIKVDGKNVSVEGHTHEKADVQGLDSDIQNLQSQINGKAYSSHTHSISNITNLQTTLNGKASTSHNHAISDVTNLQTTLNGKSNTGHTHTTSNITGLTDRLNGIANANITKTTGSFSTLNTTINGMTNQNVGTALQGVYQNSINKSTGTFSNLTVTSNLTIYGDINGIDELECEELDANGLRVNGVSIEDMIRNICDERINQIVYGNY